MAKIKIAKKDPAEENKWPKQAALYVYRPETSYRCDQCVFWRDRKCALFAPTEPIKESASCNFFIHGDPGKFTIPIMGLVNKIEAGYEESKNGFSCARCEYYLPEVNGCEKVNKYSEGDTPGIISQHACCNRFDADKKRGDMSDAQLNQLYGKN